MIVTERVCKQCDGMGMRIVERADGRHLAEVCECRLKRRNADLLLRSRIPERYKQCTLENFEHSYEGVDRSIWSAFHQARRFVSDYPLQTSGIGLLFTGSIGTGKTHLAVGILQELVLTYGVRGLFCDHRELLKSVNHSYNPKVEATEMDILRPVFEAEVLVIDELGSAKKTEWVSDIVEHILNMRYNDKRTTLITTNYPNLPPGRSVEEGETRPSPPRPKNENFESNRVTLDDILHKSDTLRGQPASPARGAATEASAPVASRLERVEPARLARAAGGTLGERIGERMRSRLAEMCVPLEMTGSDYRQGFKRARL